MNAREVLGEMLGRQQSEARKDDVESVIKEVVRYLRPEAVIELSLVEPAWDQIESAALMLREKMHRVGSTEWSDFIKERSLMIATWINGLG